jgi:hypothetical protein
MCTIEHSLMECIQYRCRGRSSTSVCSTDARGIEDVGSDQGTRRRAEQPPDRGAKDNVKSNGEPAPYRSRRAILLIMRARLQTSRRRVKQWFITKPEFIRQRARTTPN